MRTNVATRIRLGDFEVDLGAGELRLAAAHLGDVRLNGNDGAVAIRLPHQPLRVLRMLVEADGNIVSRGEIQRELWPNDTVVEFDTGINSAVKKLRRALGDSSDDPRYIDTIAKRGYRLLVPVQRSISSSAPFSPDSKALVSAPIPRPTADVWPPVPTVDELPAEKWRPLTDRKTQASRWRIAGALVCFGLLVVGGVYFLKNPSHKLTERDKIVIGDFDNTTGDPIFDDTLRQGLTVQLEQSPFLEVIPDRKIEQALAKMGRHSGDYLTPEITREVCQRTNSKAMITGAIATLGGQYMVALMSADCISGDSLARVQEQATNKGDIPRALDAAVVSLRSKLGESIRSVKKYDTRLADETTSSLDALKAYSQGRKLAFGQGSGAAIPLLKQAITIDPYFAAAYIALANSYSDQNEPENAADYARKAYELRDKVSERERLEIEGNYYLNYTGELEKAAAVYSKVRNPYHSLSGYSSGAIIAATLGRYDEGLKLFLETKQLTGNSTTDSNIVAVYLALNRFNDAAKLLKETQEQKVANDSMLDDRFILAFLNDDSAEMQHVLSDASEVPSAQDLLLMAQSDTAAWQGKRKESRKLTQDAVSKAKASGAKETAGGYLAEQALREVEWGNQGTAKSDVAAALKLSQTLEVEEVSALVLARAGDTAGAQKLARELDKKHPDDTMVQQYWLPAISAAIALEQKNAQRAVEVLQKSKSVELGLPIVGPIVLCPAYLRGQAYLALGDGLSAAKEFQKFLDYRGLTGYFPLGSLARLGLGRALALEAANTPAALQKARNSYREFLALWEDADSDIPLYTQAKLEYARLQ
jgi:DNA-binding winged helix-turn-helix (wHTH) protein